MAWIRKLKSDMQYHEFFCIETEETVKGFPDAIQIAKRDRTCTFYEFKYTKTGKIKFQPTQPAFYKAHPDLKIRVVAYNAKTNCLHHFETSLLFNKDSRYCMNEKAEVDLNKAEY
jgi:hypothetical protein